MKKIFVTGAAGFIGSNLVDHLLGRGHQVVGWDNFSTGLQQFLTSAHESKDFQLVEGHNNNIEKLTAAMSGCDFVFHLAANADVRFGLEHPRKDIEENTLATFNVLEAMRANNIRQIAFSSTGSIYGEPEVFPTPENYQFPIQTSLYGASKLACESLISAYCEGFNFEGYVFRFVSILGPRYTHGHVIDFYKQLVSHPDHLNILGDGNQRKSYLNVRDCLTGMLSAIDQKIASTTKHRFAIFNLGTTEYCTIRQSIGWICEAMQLQTLPELRFAGGERGWVGDSPFIFLDTEKIIATGWKAQFTIQQSVTETLKWLQANHSIVLKRN